jgi:hypothetical protein
MSPKENIIIVCGNGKWFRSAQTLTTNSSTFMYMNKSIITTMDVLRLQQQLAARNALKRSQSVKELYKLS